MKILNMRKADFNKTKAFFTLDTKNFLIHQVRLVQAPSGKMVIQMPFRTYQSKGVQKYEPIIEYKDVDYLDALAEEALKIYEKLK